MGLFTKFSQMPDVVKRGLEAATIMMAALVAGEDSAKPEMPRAEPTAQVAGQFDSDAMPSLNSRLAGNPDKVMPTISVTDVREAQSLIADVNTPQASGANHTASINTQSRGGGGFSRG